MEVRKAVCDKGTVGASVSVIVKNGRLGIPLVLCEVKMR